MWIPLTIDIQCMMNIPEVFTNISMHSISIVPYLSAPAYGRYQNLAPQSITEKPPLNMSLMKFVITPMLVDVPVLYKKTNFRKDKIQKVKTIKKTKQKTLLIKCTYILHTILVLLA